MTQIHESEQDPVTMVNPLLSLEGLSVVTVNDIPSKVNVPVASVIISLPRVKTRPGIEQLMLKPECYPLNYLEDRWKNLWDELKATGNAQWFHLPESDVTLPEQLELDFLVDSNDESDSDDSIDTTPMSSPISVSSFSLSEATGHLGLNYRATSVQDTEVLGQEVSSISSNSQSTDSNGISSKMNVASGYSETVENQDNFGHSGGLHQSTGPEICEVTDTTATSNKFSEVADTTTKSRKDVSENEGSKLNEFSSKWNLYTPGRFFTVSEPVSGVTNKRKRKAKDQGDQKKKNKKQIKGENVVTVNEWLDPSTPDCPPRKDEHDFYATKVLNNLRATIIPANSRKLGLQPVYPRENYMHNNTGIFSASTGSINDGALNTFIYSRQMIQPMLEVFHFKIISTLISTIWADTDSLSVGSHYAIFGWYHRVFKYWTQIHEYAPLKLTAGRESEERKFVRSTGDVSAASLIHGCLAKALGTNLAPDIRGDLECISKAYARSPFNNSNKKRLLAFLLEDSETNVQL